MKYLLIVALSFVMSASAHAQDVFSACEEVSEMAVLAKDNIPFWTTNRNSAVQSCYEDIKAFLEIATPEDVAQFNNEYEGQITIYTTDADFADHLQSKIKPIQKYSTPVPASLKITPNLDNQHSVFFEAV